MARPPESPTPSAPPAPVRILLVEDDEAHAELIRRAFASFPRPVRLASASTIEEARASTALALPDLIIADLRLPDGDGVELVPADRARPPYPVVIMTSHGDEHVAVETMKMGALDYVVKSEVTLAQMPYIAERALREWGHVVERERMAEALRASEEHFRSLIENALDLIAVLAEDGTLRYVSPSTERILGFRAEETVGRPLLDLVHPKDRETARGTFEGAFRAPGVGPSSATLRVRAKDGSWRFVEAIGTVHPDGQGGRRAVINGRDVTERVLAEEARKELEAQLRQAQKLETLGTLAGGIAHDFNNILHAILGCAQLALKRVPSDGPAAPYLNRAVEAAGRGRDLVSQILTFSRRGELERRLVNMKTAVKDAVQLVRDTLPAGIELREELGDDDAPVLADETQIHQVLLNLCTNARQAMEARDGLLLIRLGTVEVTGEPRRAPRGLPPGRYVELGVTDTGHGMSDATRERIFEPFFTTKSVGRGTGLGLSVVHGIVTGYGGQIACESALGQGTTFRVYLPLAASELV